MIWVLQINISNVHLETKGLRLRIKRFGFKGLKGNKNQRPTYEMASLCIPANHPSEGTRDVDKAENKVTFNVPLYAMPLDTVPFGTGLANQSFFNP